MIKLTEQQENHLDTVRWLVSDENYGSGRTTVLAVAFLDKAFNNIGSEIIIFDHNHFDRGIAALKSSIHDVFHSINSEDKYMIQFNKKSIVVSFK